MTSQPGSSISRAMNAKKNKFISWPFKEAQRLVSSFGKDPAPSQVLFQTGYGPSGLPHIGTFAEVARTTWVMNSYKELTGGDAKIIAFSDDLDGLRKVPGNLPNQEMLKEHAAALSEEQRQAILCGNVAELYGIDLAPLQ